MGDKDHTVLWAQQIDEMSKVYIKFQVGTECGTILSWQNLKMEKLLHPMLTSCPWLHRTFDIAVLAVLPTVILKTDGTTSLHCILAC